MELGRAAALWRYPVKSMLGEQLEEADFAERVWPGTGLTPWRTWRAAGFRTPRGPDGRASSVSGRT
jgi:hypothetical protein